MSSSDPWRRFAACLLAAAAAPVALLYLFVAVVDPWDSLPLSPPLPRVPISSNARYSFPALARSPRFDSVVLGDSSARLLRPAELDPAFGAHFANLAMNSATASEQSRMLALFLRHHPAPKVVVITLGNAWCSLELQGAARSLPEWLYAPNRWPGYAQLLNPYAVQEAANQFAVMVGLKRRRYGLDGYTSFVPPDALYDPAKRDVAFGRWPALDLSPAAGPPALPTLAVLAASVAAIPAGTRVVLFFTPYALERLGPPGSGEAARWTACKAGATAIARARGATLLDFQVPSPITTDRDNFWDPVHYRQAIASRVAAGLAAGHSPDAATLAQP